MAPNMVTMIGTMALMFMFGLSAYVSPDMGADVCLGMMCVCVLCVRSLTCILWLVLPRFRVGFVFCRGLACSSTTPWTPLTASKHVAPRRHRRLDSCLIMVGITSLPESDLWTSACSHAHCACRLRRARPAADYKHLGDMLAAGCLTHHGSVHGHGSNHVLPCAVGGVPRSLHPHPHWLCWCH